MIIIELVLKSIEVPFIEFSISFPDAEAKLRCKEECKENSSLSPSALYREPCSLTVDCADNRRIPFPSSPPARPF